MLPVAVEVSPANQPREQVTALLAACSRAVGDAECLLAADAPDGGTQAVAIVTWQSDGRATVEVGLRREGKPEWRSRNVSFLASDEPIERWRAVGFVVGTLARGEAPAKPGAEPETAKPEQKAPAVASKPHPDESAVPTVLKPERKAGHAARAALELGAVMGPGLDGLRSGAVLRTRWPLYDRLRSLFALKYVERPRDDSGLRGQWLTLAAGVAGVIGSERSELNATLDARAEYFRASAEAADGRTGADSRWLPGFALGVGGAWSPAPPFGVYLAAEGAWMLSSTSIRLSSQPHAEDRALRVAVDGGIRLRLW